MPFPKEMTKRLGSARGWRCEVCGKRWQDGYLMEAHHKLPTSLGGKDTEDNFILLCLECHYKAHLAIARTQQASVSAVKARLDKTGGKHTRCR